MISRWLRLTVFLFISNYALARPNGDDASLGKPIESSVPITDVDALTADHLPKRKGIEDLAVVARASNDDPALSPSVAKVTDQLIDVIGQMVDKDIRTPPKLQEKIEAATDSVNGTESSPVVDKVEANGKFKLATDVSEGKASSSKNDDVIKGVAVPVIMDEDLQTPPKKLQKIPNPSKPAKEEQTKKKATSTTTTTVKSVKETPTTTPSSGLSTWILLSDNRESTTPSTKNKKTSTTTKKPNKVQTTTSKTLTSKAASKKAATTTKPDTKHAEPVSALEAMVNNQKKNSTVRGNQKKKVDNLVTKESGEKVVTIPPAIIIETTEIATTDSENKETSEETTTKKKTSTKKRKKNKNRRKKPAEKSGADQDVKDVVKQPKQPVGAQLYNFLSREIMPTVGLGLVGVLVTAGLAGLLGYNPFVGANLPVRRTYETQHGYSPSNNYYSYSSSEYGSDTDGGQNEEVLFREVLSGMPEDSRYNLPPQADATYPESQLYNSQEQAYDAAKVPDKKTNDQDSYSQTYGSTYDSYSNKESISKYPVYPTGSGGSYVYPERTTSTEKYKASSKYTSSGTIEKQPEALYRVSGDYAAEGTVDAGSEETETAWHRIGTPMDYSSQVSHVEPGPRRLDLEKMTADIVQGKSRSKRSPEGFIARLVRRSKEIRVSEENDRENEIDVDEKIVEKIITSSTTTEVGITDNSNSETEESKDHSTTESSTTGSSEPTDTPPSLLDLVKRLAQLKLRLGLNFLKTSAEAFYRYLDGVQKTVEDSMANDNSFSSMRKTWLGREVSSFPGDEIRVREKRFQRNMTK